MVKEDFKYHFDLRVRWSECDAQGIVFNGAYMDYIEVAQGGYYRNLGIWLYDEKVRRYLDTVTVKATLQYRASARLDDILDIYARISRIGNTSLVLQTEMYKQGTDELIHEAELIYVNYDAKRSAARPVPDGARNLITHFEETGEVLPIEEFPEIAAIYADG